MKYFSIAQIQEAIRLLHPHHPIFATTFFVMKKERVPVGKKVRFSLDPANAEFLEAQYQIHPKSKFFFRVMRQGAPQKDWNDPAYAGKGLQSVNTRGVQSKAFLHDRNQNTWGWSPDYLEVLAQTLPRGVKLPLFHVAVWFYRERAWDDAIVREKVVQEIINEYSLTPKELSALFQTEVISDLSQDEAFQEVPAKWYQILSQYSQPKDVPPERSGILTYLETEGVGPANQLCFDPARRLNIITGDNGLGKTFLLDLAWWALTQDWADRSPWPSGLPPRKEPTIKFAVSGISEEKPVRVRFSTKTLQWGAPSRLPTISGLVIYARVDGSFAVWDPVNRALSDASSPGSWRGVKFSREQVWDGKPGRIEGLIRDLVAWQVRPDKREAFDEFTAVLRRVSPPDLGSLKIGEPMRLPGEVLDMPTLIHPYGRVPFPFVSAGIKRIVTLAYLIVWAWEEHKIQAKLSDKREERQMVVILDEAEAHLHPKWQRVILPALLGIVSDLHAELSIQLIVATHSPLVLASSEPVFDAHQDKLFLLEMSVSGKVSLAEVPFEFRGSIDSWLTSPVFQLRHPGSRQREDAIKEALRLQQEQSVSKEQVEALTKKLKEFLAPEDPFWVRWVFFAEQHGVAV